MLDRLRAALSESYQLEELVGAGGMASVYRATDLRHGRAVAVKVLHPDLVSGESIERFNAEVRLTAGLQHPHILPLHDSGRHEDLLYYVMPFVDGAKTLRHRLDIDGRLEVEEAREMAVVIGGALDYAHRSGAIHRDIKPENILLSDGVPIIADFGIARVTDDGRSTRLTGTGLSIGTPSYMSPEQAVGDPTTDARTDVYALGALLFEMLVGEPPFGGGTSAAIMKKLFTEKAPAVRERRPDVPEFVAAAVARALEKAPEERFPSAAEFVGALRRETPSGASPAVHGGRTPAGPAADIPSVAVLPFKNVGGDSDLEYFCDGMTDELISTLARLPGVRVASRTSAFALAARGVTVDEIGTTLNVRYVLEGSVRRAGDRMRIAAQLTDTRTQLQSWGDRFDRHLDDVFALQDELATTIADALSVRLSTSDGTAVLGVRRGTANLEAYQLVLRGRYFWNKRQLDKAMECFQQAVQLDPAFAQAWAGIADGFSFLGYYGALPAAVAFDKGRAAAQRAVDADPQLAEAQYASGLFEFLLGHDLELAGRSLHRAVELGARLGAPHATLCQWLAFMGDREGSHREAESALALEPLSPLIAATVAWAAVMSGEPARGVAFARQGLDLAADSLPCLWTMGGALLEQGAAAKALQFLTPAMHGSGRLPLLVGLHAFAAAKAGDIATARAAIAELRDRPDGPRDGLVAWVHLGLGELDAAMPHLIEGLRSHDPHALQPLVMPTCGRPAAEDARYHAALAGAGLGRVPALRASMLG